MKYVDSTYSILRDSRDQNRTDDTSRCVPVCARKDITLFGNSLGVDVNFLSYNKTYDLAVCDAMIQSELVLCHCPS